VAVSRPPRMVLATLPTPLVRAARLEEAAGSGPIYVKRDDLTGFALAGNKARKLEYLLGEARRGGADVLVTAGGPGSNHCRGAAAAARLAGLDCVLVMYGEEPDPPGANLGLIRGFGAEVRFTGEPERASVDPAMEKFVAELEAAGRRPYLVPRGGATGVGALGYLDAAGELADQLEAAGVEPELVLVAAGSCGTLAGLLAGRAAGALGWRLVGATVSRPVEECEERALRIAAEASALAGTPAPRAGDVEVVDARGPGYGEPSSEADDASRLAADAEGLLLDHVFTAKGMAAFLAMVGDGPAVFIHTGGTVAAIERARGGGA